MYWNEICCVVFIVENDIYSTGEKEIQWYYLKDHNLVQVYSLITFP